MLQQHGGQTVWILLKQSRPRILDTLEHDQGRIHGAVESWRRAIQSVLFLVIAFQLISSFLHSSLLYKVCSSWYHECRTSWYKYLLFATVKSRTMKCNSNCSHAATNQNSNPKNSKSPKSRHTKSDGARIANLSPGTSARLSAKLVGTVHPTVPYPTSQKQMVMMN